MKFLSLSKDPVTTIWIHFMGISLGLCICHHLPERSIPLFGIEQYLCARCLGILCGLFMGCYLYIVFPIPLHIAVFCIFPLVVDGIMQAISIYESNDLLRLFTGTLFGIGIVSLEITLLSNF